MFHVECLIDDKDVVKLHYQLASLKVFNLEIKPVVNAKKTKNGVTEEVPGGKMIDRLSAAVRKHFTTGEFSSSEINSMIEQLGGVPTSNYTKQLVDAKVIKRKERGTFVLSK